MSEEKLYAYRGLDHNKKSVYGFVVAANQEQAEERCTAMGVKWETIYLNESSRLRSRWPSRVSPAPRAHDLPSAR